MYLSTKRIVMQYDFKDNNIAKGISSRKMHFSNFSSSSIKYSIFENNFFDNHCKSRVASLSCCWYIKLLVKYNLCPKGIFRRKIFFFLLLICKKTASSKKELKYDLIEKCRIHFTHGRKNKYVFNPVAKMTMFFFI